MNTVEIDTIAARVAEELQKVAVRDVMTTEQAADYLSMSKQRLEIWRHEGKGPCFIKLSRMVRYRREDMDEWLAEHVRSSTIDEGGVCRE